MKGLNRLLKGVWGNGRDYGNMETRGANDLKPMPHIDKLIVEIDKLIDNGHSFEEISEMIERGIIGE